jgi:hypothetical protein
MRAAGNPPLTRLRARVLPADAPVVTVGNSSIAAVPFNDAGAVLERARDYRARILSHTRTQLVLAPPRSNGELQVNTDLPSIDHARGLALCVSRYWPDPDTCRDHITRLDAEHMRSRVAARAASITRHTGSFGDPLEVPEPWNTLAVLLHDETQVASAVSVDISIRLLAALTDNPDLVSVAVALTAERTPGTTSASPVAAEVGAPRRVRAATGRTMDATPAPARERA